MVSSGAPAQGSAAAKRELRFVKRKDCARGSPDKGQENAAENTRALDLRRVALLLLLSPALLLFLFNPFALFFYFLFGSGVFWLSFLPKALFFLLLEAAILQGRAPAWLEYFFQAPRDRSRSPAPARPPRPPANSLVPAALQALIVEYASLLGGVELAARARVAADALRPLGWWSAGWRTAGLPCLLALQAVQHARALAFHASRFLTRNVLARLYSPTPSHPAPPPATGAISTPAQARAGPAQARPGTPHARTAAGHGPASGQISQARLGAASGPASGHRAAPGTAPAHRPARPPTAVLFSPKLAER